MKVQGINYGPALKIKSDKIARLANQRAILGTEIQKLKDQRFLVTSKLISLEQAQHKIQTELHETQREIFHLHDKARQEEKARESIAERMLEWAKQGLSPEECLAKARGKS